ncbi:CehA/McbA family metallohydrolase [uncultured Anaerococcus sp.]|uniref:CehA/McbA family metallohydrolase n=1 Tax=uncultured Anaerococcus sp. TaxID=293428 RepID=UPI0025DABBEB|nr:CehA/McbA family metallohydrolase [uncultured Anaerococcus sp.]
MSNLKYVPVLLHSHSHHSDGHLTPEEVVRNAKDFGYKAMFLTDHNTDAGVDEIYDKNFDKDILPVFHGVEWTTFFGHLLILGSHDAGNYTKATLTNIEDCMDEISAEYPDAIFSINHPFDMGNPICTGCHFEFNIDDYSKFSYLELINGENSENSKSTQLAYRFWKKLLNDGYRLAALGGRDWHVKSKDDDSVPINMIGINGEINEKNILAAIKNANTYLTYGIIFNYNFKNTELGNEISEGDFAGNISIEKGNFKNANYLNIVPKKIVIFNNEDLVFEKEINFGEDIEFNINPKKGYLRFEVLGDMKDTENIRLVTTSPIFVK